MRSTSVSHKASYDYSKSSSTKGKKNLSPANVARSKSQDGVEKYVTHTQAVTPSCVIAGGGVTVGGGRSSALPMNNVRGTPSVHTATEVNSSDFYSTDVQGNMRASRPTGTGVLPAGTSVIVNDLQSRGGGGVRGGGTGLTSSVNFAEYAKDSDRSTIMNLNRTDDEEHFSVCETNGTNEHLTDKDGDPGAAGPWVSREGSAGMQSKCRTTGCEFFGSEANDRFCSGCYRDIANARNSTTKVIRL